METESISSKTETEGDFVERVRKLKRKLEEDDDLKGLDVVNGEPGGKPNSKGRRIDSLTSPSAASSITRGSSISKYTNHGQHASGQGSITNIANYQYGPSNPLEELEKRCSHGAAFDSSTRFLIDPPRCAESTRLRIIQIIEQWVNNSEGDNSESPSLFWLHGGAGVGKSAVAQSLSEKFKKRKQLAASFFFFRSDATRDNGEPLIPTLVSQLVDSFEGILPFVEDSIRKNRALFTKTYEVQIQELLIEPLLALKSKGVSAHPQLIVIDGLDECQNPDIQCELLRVIARAIPQIPYPLRFLITSRPEAHITHVFSHDPDLQAIPVHQYNLTDDPDADTDIRKVLEDEFVEIRRVHRLRRYLPHTWPGQKAVTSLVERSSGHFIYASTVIRYIRSPKHRPDDRLEVILRLRPSEEGDRPYAQLDALYALIFAGVESRSELEKICLVLGILHFQSKRVGIFWRLGRDCTTIEELLEMKAGDLLLLLDPILSLIAFHDDKVRILHKSLHDYLLDATRGGHLPVDLARVHESAATYVLKQRILKRLCDVDDFREFAYHCQYAYLNDTLKNYLNSLESPFPKCVMSTPKTFPSWGDATNEFLRKLIWYFFRTLSRETLDSTGQVYGEVYEKYVSMWNRYFMRQGKGLSLGSEMKSGEQYVLDSKYKLDALLREWKPRHFNQKNVGIDQRKRDYLTTREHDVLSDFGTESFYYKFQAIASSLVFCDHFIHSYNLGLQDNMLAFVTLRTYSRHDNTCYQVERVANRDKVVQEIMDYVTRNEEYLFSGLYQKYGVLEPDVVGMSSHSIQKTKAVLAEL